MTGPREYTRHYHHEGNHQGLANALIDGNLQDAAGKGAVARRDGLGGLLNFYYREAARAVLIECWHLEALRTGIVDHDVELLGIQICPLEASVEVVAPLHVRASVRVLPRVHGEVAG